MDNGGQPILRDFSAVYHNLPTSLDELFNAANASLGCAEGYVLFDAADGLRNRWIGAARGLPVVDDSREGWRLLRRHDGLWEKDINMLVEKKVLPKAKFEANFDGDLDQASKDQPRSILDRAARLLKVHARRQQKKAKSKLKK